MRGTCELEDGGSGWDEGMRVERSGGTRPNGIELSPHAPPAPWPARPRPPPPPPGPVRPLPCPRPQALVVAEVVRAPAPPTGGPPRSRPWPALPRPPARQLPPGAAAVLPPPARPPRRPPRPPPTPPVAPCSPGPTSWPTRPGTTAYGSPTRTASMTCRPSSIPTQAARPACSWPRAGRSTPSGPCTPSTRRRRWLACWSSTASAAWTRRTWHRAKPGRPPRATHTRPTRPGTRPCASSRAAPSTARRRPPCWRTCPSRRPTCSTCATTCPCPRWWTRASGR